jgi:hypothetical protein
MYSSETNDCTTDSASISSPSLLCANVTRHNNPYRLDSSVHPNTTASIAASTTFAVNVPFEANIVKTVYPAI